jgi:hypothetical protein
LKDLYVASQICHGVAMGVSAVILAATNGDVLLAYTVSHLCYAPLGWDLLGPLLLRD